MVEFEFTDPTRGFLVGMDLMDGETTDITPGETTDISILSFGLLFFKINILFFKK